MVDVKKKKKNMNMGFVLVKKIAFLFLVISAALLSTYFAGRAYKYMESKEESTISCEELESLKQLHHDEAASEIHERLLKVKTNDYGRYDPPPAFVEPPFKLIPN